MGLNRAYIGMGIASVSAILLFLFMFFDWFGIRLTNNSNLLFDIRGDGPGRNAWEALDVISIILVVTIIGTLSVTALRFTEVVRKPPISLSAVAPILGLVSMLLILWRIVDPPTFGVEQKTITLEGTVQLPIFLALLAAAGVVVGGCLAMRASGSAND